MPITTSDVVSQPQGSANQSELANDIKTGAGKIGKEYSDSYIAIVDGPRLGHHPQLEQERIHLLLMADASRGLADVAVGNVKEARATLSPLKLLHIPGNST